MFWFGLLQRKLAKEAITSAALIAGYFWRLGRWVRALEEIYKGRPRHAKAALSRELNG
jgi:hypothetical protein